MLMARALKMVPFQSTTSSRAIYLVAVCLCGHPTMIYCIYTKYVFYLDILDIHPCISSTLEGRRSGVHSSYCSVVVVAPIIVRYVPWIFVAR